LRFRLLAVEHVFCYFAGFDACHFFDCGAERAPPIPFLL
jgi:hypothetical protein